MAKAGAAIVAARSDFRLFLFGGGRGLRVLPGEELYHALAATEKAPKRRKGRRYKLGWPAAHRALRNRVKPGRGPTGNWLPRAETSSMAVLKRDIGSYEMVSREAAPYLNFDGGVITHSRSSGRISVPMVLHRR